MYFTLKSTLYFFKGTAHQQIRSIQYIFVLLASLDLFGFIKVVSFEDISRRNFCLVSHIMELDNIWLVVLKAATTRILNNNVSFQKL